MSFKLMGLAVTVMASDNVARVVAESFRPFFTRVDREAGTTVFHKKRE
jgi:hypothetical protein